jgi:hypothetical protein
MDANNTTERIDQGGRRPLGTTTMGIAVAGAAIAIALAVLAGKAFCADK